MAVFLLPCFFALKNIFYAEAISDIVGMVVTGGVFLIMIVPYFKQQNIIVD